MNFMIFFLSFGRLRLSGGAFFVLTCCFSVVEGLVSTFFCVVKRPSSDFSIDEPGFSFMDLLFPFRQVRNWLEGPTVMRNRAAIAQNDSAIAAMKAAITPKIIPIASNKAQNT